MNNIILDITRHCIIYLIMVKIFENAQKYLKKLTGLEASNNPDEDKIKKSEIVVNKGVSKKKLQKSTANDSQSNHFIINLNSLRENRILDYSNKGCALQLDISEKHLQGCKHQKTRSAGTSYIGKAVYPYTIANGKIVNIVKSKENQGKKVAIDLSNDEVSEDYKNILKKISEINVDVSNGGQRDLNPFYQNIEEFSMRFTKDAATNLSTAMMLTKSEEELYNI